ncbi:Predicted SnoaL-like aldol condensation-catalyzing enzyme [Marivirga sericea]|uniref:Predicted SnoaL-like aldol condensation-catalyzing enzyme n=1 Tax=Marivirga sericea TaxID=1028 RepID=A0A1X7KET7_9BACT|nr:nuclear transport factor 2 family protein [Marivirga sericea]SMG39625.1 Predicted SnoaL-like aldol condensation-catalyzing enzyme [Marivirga sericea]
MKRSILTLLFTSLFIHLNAQTDTLKLIDNELIENRNKELTLGFYQDLWFTDNTDNYKKYVAETYVVHDIGDRKGVTEPAIEQKIIADRLWENGTWDSKINYQIADGDLVATRWEATYKPETLLGKVVFGAGTIPIINVFRFNEEGKIVEIWNHRHDIDTNRTMMFTIKGLLIGLLIALIPTIIAIRLKRKLKKQASMTM